MGNSTRPAYTPLTNPYTGSCTGGGVFDGGVNPLSARTVYHTAQCGQRLPRIKRHTSKWPLSAAAGGSPVKLSLGAPLLTNTMGMSGSVNQFTAPPINPPPHYLVPAPPH